MTYTKYIYYRQKKTHQKDTRYMYKKGIKKVISQTASVNRGNCYIHDNMVCGSQEICNKHQDE